MNTFVSLTKTHGRALVAEALGTALLTTAVLVSLMTGNPTVLIAPIMLTFLTFTMGGVSGAHVNPALTVGALFGGMISWKRALGYIVAQVVGALAVLGIAHAIPSIQQSGILSQIAQQMTATSMAPIAIGEIVALAIFSFGVATAMLGKVSESARPIVVGLSFLVALIVTLAWGGAIANPAVAIGLGVFSVARLVAPLLGAIIGVGVARFIYQK